MSRCPVHVENVFTAIPGEETDAIARSERYDIAFVTDMLQCTKESKTVNAMSIFYNVAKGPDRP